jgi:hypothetical protein
MPNVTTSEGIQFFTGPHLAQERAIARPYDADDGQAGMVTPSSRGWQYLTSALSANQARVGRFRPSRTMTIGSIAFVVTTASGTNDSVDVGIYTADLATKIVSSGATAGLLNNGTGVKSVAITATTLTAGVVYYAALAVSATGGTLSSAAYTTTDNVSGFGATPGLMESGLLATSYPLPATLASAAPTGSPFALWLREA